MVAGADTDVRRLSVAPFNDADARDFVNLLGNTLSPDGKNRVIKEGQGHPLFLHEMIRFRMALHFP